MASQHISVALIGGPTASGKSALALLLAERLHGSIVNADSMQTYQEMPLLTAQPRREDRGRIPHYLYSIFHAHDIGSVGRWQKLALEAIKRVHSKESFPLVVGGTGLYLASLARGIATVPVIPLEIREQARHLWNELGPEGFYGELEAIDPLGAKHLYFRDQQRLIRAYEVKKATNVSLFEWWQAPDANIQALRPKMIVLLPPREEVYANAEKRLKEMLKTGALEEIEKFAKQLSARDLPLTKALGFRPFRSYLEGHLSYDDALTRTLYDIRHYIKRQYTWFHHQPENALYLKSFPTQKKCEDIVKWLLQNKK